jgi:hypothetical protein
MFNVIIISKDQCEYLPLLIESLNSQLPNINRLFVLDRCTDDSAKYLYDRHEKFIENKIGEGFLAGKSRDIGLKHCGIDNTLFLDGDRILNGFTVDIVEQAFNYDLCLIKIEHDFRTIFKSTFTENPFFGNINNDVFSCGITVKKDMIQKIVNLQHGRLFNEAFDCNFGEEDRFLGDMVFFNNGTCGLFPNSCYLSGKFSTINYNAAYRQQCITRLELKKYYNIPKPIMKYVNHE